MATPERKWCPAGWLDELPPESGKSPDDFLRRDPATGVLQLWPIGATEEQDAEFIEWAARDLKDGDVVLFVWHEPRGSRTMTVQPDGTYTLDEPFPADTNCFDDEEGNWGVTGDLADIARGLAEEPGTELPASFEVDGWVWSDGTSFRLRALESGAAHFEEVSANKLGAAARSA